MTTMPAAPMVVLAGWYQFLPSDRLEILRIKCRTLLWCRSGAGQVWINGTQQLVSPGSFLFLPWGYGIRYRAAQRQPFLLGGVHYIPLFAGTFVPEVAHATNQLTVATSREDDPTLPDRVLSGQFDDHPGLGPLVEYLAQTWAQRPPDAALAFAQGALLQAAILRMVATPDASLLPSELLRLREAVLRRLDRTWSLASMANTVGCSTAWLVRLVRRHWRTSPCRWLQQQRLERARSLLTTTDRSVGETASAVGIPDRGHFSRVFRAAYGAPPQSWRHGHHGW
ncbi:MAG: AraC family transcriptional regulator [Planctomycetota bacterium]